MSFAAVNGATLHYRFNRGNGPIVVFLNALGTDLRIWDGVITRLGTRISPLCLDQRGHGLSDDAPVTMDILVQDVAGLMDHLGLGPAIVCGVSVGGMIAQRLAAMRPDLVAGLLLCCTGAKIGTPTLWNSRIADVERQGLAKMAAAISARWFTKGFCESQPAMLAGYRNMLARSAPDGYTGLCRVLRDTDLTTQSAGLSLPARLICGDEDLATPPELVAELAGLIPDARLTTLSACAHLPPIEAPERVAAEITAFTEEYDV